MSKVLLVGGLGMKIGDYEPGQGGFWSLGERLIAKGHEVLLRECMQSADPGTVCTLNDMLWATDTIVASYGLATTKAIETTAKKLSQWPWEKAHDTRVVIAGVPDRNLGQFKFGMWHAETEDKRAISYNVDDIPFSCPLRTLGAEKVTLEKIPLGWKYLNVNCNPLFPAIDIPSVKHSGVINHPKVLDSIASLF